MSAAETLLATTHSALIKLCFTARRLSETRPPLRSVQLSNQNSQHLAKTPKNGNIRNNKEMVPRRLSNQQDQICHTVQVSISSSRCTTTSETYPSTGGTAALTKPPSIRRIAGAGLLKPMGHYWHYVCSASKHRAAPLFVTQPDCAQRTHALPTKDKTGR